MLAPGIATFRLLPLVPVLATVGETFLEDVALGAVRVNRSWQPVIGCMDRVVPGVFVSVSVVSLVPLHPASRIQPVIRSVSDLWRIDGSPGTRGIVAETRYHGVQRVLREIHAAAARIPAAATVSRRFRGDHVLMLGDLVDHLNIRWILTKVARFLRVDHVLIAVRFIVAVRPVIVVRSIVADDVIIVVIVAAVLLLLDGTKQLLRLQFPSLFVYVVEQFAGRRAAATDVSCIRLIGVRHVGARLRGGLNLESFLVFLVRICRLNIRMIHY